MTSKLTPVAPGVDNVHRRVEDDPQVRAAADRLVGNPESLPDEVQRLRKRVAYLESVLTTVRQQHTDAIERHANAIEQNRAVVALIDGALKR